MTPRRARPWFAATAACVLAGVHADPGAIAHWYPYPFIDVTRLGYFKAAVNCVWVAPLLLGSSAGAKLLDGWLAQRRSGSERSERA